LLLWIQGSPSPQDLRNRLLIDTQFRQELVQWLEFCHTGDFYTDGEDALAAEWERPAEEKTVSGRRVVSKPSLLITDAATVSPRVPPELSTSAAEQDWYRTFRGDVDRVVFCSNRHDKAHSKGCLRGDPPYCRARFPRESVVETQVDLNSGAIQFQKRDVWINTYQPVLSAALRCNTDVTCLLSGTQVRAIIAYVTDYVTKSSLTTHTFFTTIRTV
ncbi:hypothetical protein FKP32DRAFT_1549131, partial [Trametes sanguinea]